MESYKTVIILALRSAGEGFLIRKIAGDGVFGFD